MSTADGAATGTVVVGTDGSGASREALAYAAEEAHRRGSALRVVAVEDTTHDAWLAGYGAPQYIVQERHETFARMAREAVARTLGDDPSVTLEIAAGNPAGVLLERAAGADLLVVGSRGHGGFAGLVLGSVSQQCVLHAPCPVTVVPVGTARGGTADQHGERAVPAP